MYSLGDINGGSLCEQFIKRENVVVAGGYKVSNHDLRLTILMSIRSFSLWKMQKSVRGNSPRREKPIANQLYFSLMPFFTWKNTFFSGQSTIHVNFTCSTGSSVTECIWLGETSSSDEVMSERGKRILSS
jgi:hypothetical protein